MKAPSILTLKRHLEKKVTGGITMKNNFQFIDDKMSLESLIQNLKMQGVIAIDLEHHNTRSFQGFTCLI